MKLIHLYCVVMLLMCYAVWASLSVPVDECRVTKGPITSIAWVQLGSALPAYMDRCYTHVS